ncbi:MAG: hypothetical protein K6E28_03725 [Eubacterium sp.]|nr:hypothetical protein [Eubacterium sp.]
MIRKGIIKFSKKSVAMAVLAALILVSSASSTGGLKVYADETETPDTVEDKPGSEGEEADVVDEEKDETNILEPQTGRVEFWDWKKVTSVKDAFGDNKYHPVLMLSMRENDYGKSSFFSSYMDRNHVYLPTYTNRINNFSSEFPSVPGNPETTVDGKFGYYGRYSNEEHSPAYYMDAEENLYLHLSDKGRRGLDRKYLYMNRFFTVGSSMGVPWMKVSQWGPDGGRTMMYITYPKKELSGGEAMLYQPDNTDYYLYVGSYVGPGGSRSEPVVYATHTQSIIPVQDNWHLITYSGLTCGYSDFSNVWALVGLNNDYENSVAQTNWGNNILNGNNDSCVYTIFRDKSIEIIPQGTKSDPMRKRAGVDYLFQVYVGTPHLFTSIVTQTIEEGKLLPITAGTFMGQSKDDDKKDSPTKSEGIILPKDEVLTIDGGTVYVDTNFINNGRIVIKNGGTLLVKDGGCISPYTDQCAGQGTIECDGGNVVVMPGGSIYGFCNGGSSTESLYDVKNAPIRIVGGGTLINYGRVITTFAVVGKGSKIEVRKKGLFRVGFNRIDEYEFMANKPENICEADPGDYAKPVTIGLFGIYTYEMLPKQYMTGKTIQVKEKATVIVEKTATFTHKGKYGEELAPSNMVDIIVPEF